LVPRIDEQVLKRRTVAFQQVILDAADQPFGPSQGSLVMTGSIRK
jgi:hypothetical protein